MLIARPTSRIAHRCLGSCSLILPFGNPHPAEDLQPLTSTHCGRVDSLYVSERITVVLCCTRTLSHLSLSMIAPHTGTRVLYFMKDSKPLS